MDRPSDQDIETARQLATDRLIADLLDAPDTSDGVYAAIAPWIALSRVIDYVASLPPAADEWIDHGGGDCPVAGDTMVAVRFRGGRVIPPRPAVHWSWRSRGLECDIVSYRVEKAAP